MNSKNLFGEREFVKIAKYLDELMRSHCVSKLSKKEKKEYLKSLEEFLVIKGHKFRRDKAERLSEIDEEEWAINQDRIQIHNLKHRLTALIHGYRRKLFGLKGHTASDRDIEKFIDEMVNHLIPVYYPEEKKQKKFFNPNN